MKLTRTSESGPVVFIPQCGSHTWAVVPFDARCVIFNVFKQVLDEMVILEEFLWFAQCSTISEEQRFENNTTIFIFITANFVSP